MSIYSPSPIELPAGGPLDVAFVDLDNCISDDKWRWELFDLHLPIINERYQRYHEACESDLYQNSFIIRELAQKASIIIATARPESVRIKTQRWLNRWRVPHIRLLMRPNNDHRSSIPLKRDMLRSLPEGFKVRYAIDDRIDILDMYADEGVSICRHVSINQPEIQHP